MTACPPGEPCPRCAEYERRLDELQTMYDRIAAELIEALDRASAYRVTAAQQQTIIENGRRTENWGPPFGEEERRAIDAVRRYDDYGKPSIGRRVKDASIKPPYDWCSNPPACIDAGRCLRNPSCSH